MASSTRATRFGWPKSIASQSLLLGDSKLVQRLCGDALKFVMPSWAIATLSKRDVNEASALGKPLPLAL